MIKYKKESKYEQRIRIKKRKYERYKSDSLN